MLVDLKLILVMKEDNVNAIVMLLEQNVTNVAMNFTNFQIVMVITSFQIVVLQITFIYKHYLACGCDEHGSIDTKCDNNGTCDCNEGYAGSKCDVCAEGYSGFPNCQGM